MTPFGLIVLFDWQPLDPKYNKAQTNTIEGLSQQRYRRINDAFFREISGSSQTNARQQVASWE